MKVWEKDIYEITNHKIVYINKPVYYSMKMINFEVYRNIRKKNISI